MMKMKKLSAALLAVLMAVSMMSCIVLGASAEPESGLGGPVKIEKVEADPKGIEVPGKDLPAGLLVVNSDWADAVGLVSIKLDGITYRATLGYNAFAEIADAAEAATVNAQIYVAPGIYEADITVQTGGMKIYGPYAGVSANTEGNLSKGNPNRPSADVTSSMDATDEAVFTGIINFYQAGSNLTVDGLYLYGSSYFNLAEGGKYRVGTYVKNNIVNVTSANLFAMDRGQNFNFMFENNRVLNANSIVTMGGMGDITVRNNYFNTSNYAVVVTSVQSGSMGAYCKIEGNHFGSCNGIFRYDRGQTGYQTVLYSAQILNNYVERNGTNYLVWNAFYALNTLPGTNVQVTGNTFLNLQNGVAPFNFPYYKNEGNVNMYRHMININENYIDLPAGSNFINSEMNGVLNCAYNYYTNGISASQVTKYTDTQLILYPYYSDPEMTTLMGDAKITGVNLSEAVINEEEKTVYLDMRSNDLDYIDMDAALIVSEGCSWKLYEDQTLSTEVKNKRLYFDGVTTVRYVEILSPDGVSSSVYRIYATKNYGSEAKLIDVLIDSEQVASPEIVGTTYKYTLPADVAFLNYDLKVSSGATYELFADSMLTEPLVKTGSYIPYGGYQVYILITSEDKSTTSKYCLDFERPYSEYYDPCVVEGVAPAGNYVVRHNRKWIGYYCQNLLASETFDFMVTPGATYKIYADQDLTKELSRSGDVKALALSEGTNTFYIKVEDSAHSNVLTFVVYNGTRSSDTTILGLATGSSAVAGGVITAVGTGDTMSVRFNTRSPYATCRVFADQSKQIELKYTSTPITEEGSIRVIDERTFNLATELAGNVYFVECMAENGAIEDYMLVVQKSVAAKSYTDVSDGAWYTSYIEDASAMGMLGGELTGNDEEGNEIYAFRPDDFASRQELAVIICRMLGVNRTAFEEFAVAYKDADQIAAWANGYVRACYAFGIMQGSLEGNDLYFLPENSITRQEVMLMFSRMYGLTGSYDLSVFHDSNLVAPWAQSGVEAVVASGLILGDENGYLNPDAKISRAEIAAIIVRAIEYAANM